MKDQQSRCFVRRPSILTVILPAPNHVHDITLTALLLRPKARGQVSLTSSDPFADPLVDTQIFGHEDDLHLTLACDPISELIDREMFPSSDVTSDEALSRHCRRMVKTGYHPVATCKMGYEADEMAVLDKKLRVKGVKGLRVVDAHSCQPL